MKLKASIPSHQLTSFFELNFKKRKILVEKIFELGNLSFASLVFTQFTQPTPNLVAISIGILTFATLFIFGIHYLKRGKNV